MYTQHNRSPQPYGKLHLLKTIKLKNSNSFKKTILYIRKQIQPLDSLQEQRSTYFQNLDALRLFTFIVVFLRHGFFTNNHLIAESETYKGLHEIFAFAFMGLDLFSVLSSFLITWLILEEYKDSKNFNMKNFFMRRILRIWPLYFVILVIAYLLLPLIAGYFNQPLPELPPAQWFVFFVANYYVAYVNEDFLFFLVFLWFISIEEQFYLVWAFVMKFLKNHIPWVAAAFVGIYLAFKYIYYGTPIPSFYDTLNYLPDFAAGAMLAWSAFNKNKAFQWLQSIPRSGWRLFYLFFALIVVFYRQIFSNLDVDHFKHIVLSIVFSMIIFDQCFNNTPLFRAGRFKLINYLGRLNFGLYCWHGVVITLIKKGMEISGHQDSPLDVYLLYPLISLLLSLGLAVISYEFYEKRFLKLKQYFSPSKSV